MQNVILQEESEVKVYGKIFTVKEYADKYTEGNIDRATGILEILLKKGNARLITGQLSKEEKKLEKAMKENSIVELAHISENREEELKDYQAEKKRENRQVYPEVMLDYPDLIYAEQAEAYYRENLRIEETEVKKVNGKAYLVLKNITDKELSFVNLTYNRDRTVLGAMTFTRKGVENVTGGIDYTAKNVISPTLKIGIRGALSILKTSTTLIARTGATVVTGTTQGVKDTAKELRQDEEILRAQKDMIETKDTIKRTIVNTFGSNGGLSNGITIVG